jgi:hypothetical protein
MTRSERALVQMMWVMISQRASTTARYRFPLPAVIATRRTFAAIGIESKSCSEFRT